MQAPDTDRGRRRFLTLAGTTALAGSAAAGGLAAPALAQDKIRLRMVSAWPKNAPGVGVNAERFARRLEALSDGRIEVRFFAAGELVPPFGVMDAVSQGTADLGHGTPYYYAGKVPAAHFFTGVPFGLDANEFAAWCRFGGGQALWDETMAPFGIKPFYAGSSGSQALGWFNREIKTLDDLQGLKFRIAGLGGEVMRRLGVVPVLTPPGEIAAALSSGVVDAVEWIGPWNDIAFGLQRYAKYYYMPGVFEPGPGLEVIVNTKTYEGLPAGLQEAIRTAAEATANETLADFTYHNIVAYQTVLSQGVALRTMPQPIVERMAEVSKDVIAEVGNSQPTAKKVYDSYVAFLAQAKAYSPKGLEGTLAMRALGG